MTNQSGGMRAILGQYGMLMQGNRKRSYRSGKSEDKNWLF
jgi:hypothetical protein